MYQRDASDPMIETQPRVAMDLQKVILIPTMDQFKRSVFTSRLCLDHETFSILRSKFRKKKDMTIIWHEAIAGRQDEDIVRLLQVFQYSS